MTLYHCLIAHQLRIIMTTQSELAQQIAALTEQNERARAEVAEHFRLLREGGA